MEQQMLDKTLSWLKEAVESARAEAKTGNIVPLNALGRNPALSFYINNVSSGLLTEAEFAVQNPHYVHQAADLMEQYNIAAQVGDLPGRVGVLEEAIATLPVKIAEALKAAGITVNVTESEPPADPEPVETPPAPVKPAPAKGKKPADAPPATDPAVPPATDPTGDPPAAAE